MHSSGFSVQHEEGAEDPANGHGCVHPNPELNRQRWKPSATTAYSFPPR
jgi:hypothetical protein